MGYIWAGAELPPPPGGLGGLGCRPGSSGHCLLGKAVQQVEKGRDLCSEGDPWLYDLGCRFPL